MEEPTLNEANKILEEHPSIDDYIQKQNCVVENNQVKRYKGSMGESIKYYNLCVSILDKHKTYYVNK